MLLDQIRHVCWGITISKAWCVTVTVHFVAKIPRGSKVNFRSKGSQLFPSCTKDFHFDWRSDSNDTPRVRDTDCKHTHTHTHVCAPWESGVCVSLCVCVCVCVRVCHSVCVCVCECAHRQIPFALRSFLVKPPSAFQNVSAFTVLEYTLLPGSSALLQRPECSQHHPSEQSPVVSAFSLTRLHLSGADSLFLSIILVSTSVGSFKSSLKTFLFSRTFSSVSFPWETSVHMCVRVCMCLRVCVYF